MNSVLFGKVVSQAFVKFEKDILPNIGRPFCFLAMLKITKLDLRAVLSDLYRVGLNNKPLFRTWCQSRS
jgi:hypothetical protein